MAIKITDFQDYNYAAINRPPAGQYPDCGYPWARRMADIDAVTIIQVLRSTHRAMSSETAPVAIGNRQSQLANKLLEKRSEPVSLETARLVIEVVMLDTAFYPR